MPMLDRSLLPLLVLAACASAPRSPARPEAPAVSEAPALAPAASEAPALPPPPMSEGVAAPPPRPLVGTHAYYIRDLAGTPGPPGAEVCDSDEACRPLVPGEDGQVSRNFQAENWVVIRSPANHAVAVVSDGKAASVTLTPRCPADDNKRGPRIVLYRVAKSVTAATVSTAPPPTCAKAPISR